MHLNELNDYFAKFLSSRNPVPYSHFLRIEVRSSLSVALIFSTLVLVSPRPEEGAETNA